MSSTATTFQDGLPFNLEDLLHGYVIESNRIELKAAWTEEIKASTLRTICAFANDLLNLGGGYVILGVEEDQGRAILPPRGLGKADLDRVQEEIRWAEARFDFDEDRTYFRVILPVHPRYELIHALRDAAHLWAIGEKRAALQHLERTFERQPASSPLAHQIVEYAKALNDEALVHKTLQKLESGQGKS